MNIREYFEVHTNDCSNASFIADYETEELVYLNQAMEKKFQIFEDYTGKLCEDIIPYYREVCGYDNKAQLELGVFLDRTFLCEMLNCNLRSKTTLLDVMGKQYIQTKYFLAPTTDKRQEAESVFEKSIALCLEILNDNQISSPINAFLKLLGEFYACDLTYIMEFDADNSSLSKSHVWTMQQRKPNIKNHTPEISISKFVRWLQNEEHKSIINLDQSEHYYEINTVESMILQHYKLKNITLCKLWNKDGNLTGVLGLSNRADLMYDDRLLQAVSHFVMEQFNKNSLVEALEELNDIDLLTGFYNREKYQMKVIQLEQSPPKSLGVLFVNLNGLRTTNEYLGYEAGDEQLKKTAALLNEYFNSSFYRITGDEFVGFVPNCEEAVFEETVESIQTRLKNQHSEAAFSLGHSWESGSYTISNLIKIADTIMVINKQAFYHETLRDMEKIQNTMLQDLFRGIDQNEFLVYLQPQVDLSTEKVVAAEALIRRQKPEKMIFPDQFISLRGKQHHTARGPLCGT